MSDPAVTARYFEGREDGADTLGRGDIVVRENATTQLYLMPRLDLSRGRRTDH